MNKKKIKKVLKNVWYFIWEDDSVWSWIVNIILAFVLIKFIVYPGLGFLLSTSHPIVAVVSSSMHHYGSFDDWWQHSSKWYLNKNITKNSFLSFSFRNGFSKGDIMILKGIQPEDIKIGDIIVFSSHKTRPRSDPIIHRVIIKLEKDDEFFFQTKGDNYKTNGDSINTCDKTGCIDETNINEEQLIGKALFKIPLLGYVKIWAVESVCLFHDFNFCINM